MILNQNVEPNLKTAAKLESNDFRRERLYTEECDDLFKKHEKVDVRAPVAKKRLAPPDFNRIVQGGCP
eukprot:9094854-Pyramimonas_sp.AAC.1